MTVASEQLATGKKKTIERAHNVLSNKYPQRTFYYLVWGAIDTEYTYGLFIEGKANQEMRQYTAGLVDGLALMSAVGRVG